MAAKPKTSTTAPGSDLTDLSDCTSSEFVERGIASIAATKRDGGSVPAEAVIARLEAKLAAARLLDLRK